MLSLVGIGLPVVVAQPAGAAGLAGIRSLSAGVDETCAVLFNTTARCWGYNNYGQLGDGTKTNRSLPVVVLNAPGTGPLQTVVQISVGDSHACALMKDGSARCWGHGGELGDGTGTTRSRPVTVLNAAGTGRLLRITQISAGGGQTCARIADGTARCWGINGSMGNGRRTSRLPAAVLNPDGTRLQRNITQISVGKRHACVRIIDGTARCWGVNASGQLGDGTRTDHFLPVKVLNVAGSAQAGITRIVATHRHTCAQVTDGTARCWGSNGYGELGDGTTTDRLRPVRVMNGLGTGPLWAIAEITLGGSHSCARIKDGTARCWGIRGALADANTRPTPTSQLRPAKVMDSTGSQPITNVTQIRAGLGHTCVRTPSGTAQCFGENAEGELGDGTTTARHFPVAVG
jgi:alpha-tubulin suppressor-like RCC1 family protein